MCYVAWVKSNLRAINLPPNYEKVSFLYKVYIQFLLY